MRKRRARRTFFEVHIVLDVLRHLVDLPERHLGVLCAPAARVSASAGPGLLDKAATQRRPQREEGGGGGGAVSALKNG